MLQVPFSRFRVLRTAAACGVVLAAFGGMALAQQDKYTLKVPGGLAFSEFRGYEAWPVVATSQNDKLVAVILANPVMIDAYLAGIPGNGKPFPDGAKMAKIHWKPAKNEFFPDTTVPGTLHDVDFMTKDTKRFADGGGWGWPRSSTTPGPIPSRPPPWLTSRRRRTTPSAGSRATREWRRKITSSRRTGSGNRGTRS